jgi:hypothetical protein
MGVTVTWSDGQGAPTTYAVSDEVMTSLEQFRQSITRFEGGQMVVTYPTVKDMIVGVFVERVVLPAVTNFPPASVVSAQANLAAAQAALVAAQAAAVGIG